MSTELPWWEAVPTDTTWYVLTGAGAPETAKEDAALTDVLTGLGDGHQHAYNSIRAHLSLDPLTERAAIAGHPDRVMLRRLPATLDDDALTVLARGASVSVIARVLRPTRNGIGTVRVLRVIPGP